MDNKVTIFDFSPTEKELHRFGGEEALRWAIDNGIYDTDDNRLYHLFLLFAGRGDVENANKYSAQIQNKSMLDTLMQDF